MSRLSRRAVLALPLAAGGCSLFEQIFDPAKPSLPGKREAISVRRRGLEVDAADRRPVNLPAPESNAEWRQAGRTPSHSGGHFAVSGLSTAWRSSIGEGGGYRRKITSTPVVADGRVFTMDSDAVVTGFDLRNGGRVWRTDTQDEKDRSTNVGGGIALVGNTVYATTGRGEALALDSGTGAIRWRKPLGAPARTSPTVVDDRLFVSTMDDRLVALNTGTGDRLWAYQAATVATTVLGRPAPAVSEGLVLAGFGSGDLTAVRAESGTSAWGDSLASGRGRSSLLDLSAISGLPAIENNRVYAIGLGGLLVSLDLRSGRRLWEREVGGAGAPWLAGDWLFVITSEQVLACLSKEDGQVRWTTDLPRYETPEKQRDPIVWVGPVLAGGRLIVGSNTEQAMSIDPGTGQVLGSQSLPGAASVSPIVAGNTVLMVTDDATLLALR